MRPLAGRSCRVFARDLSSAAGFGALPSVSILHGRTPTKRLPILLASFASRTCSRSRCRRQRVGAFVGYTYEYFERLAQYTGWSYEFVPVEGSGPAAYKTLRDLLGAGDADVAVGLMATQEGRESLAFTRDSFAALNVVLRTAAEVSDDPLDEATSDHPLRVAVIEGSPLASDLEAFCAQNEIPYETVGFADAARRATPC